MKPFARPVSHAGGQTKIETETPLWIIMEENTKEVFTNDRGKMIWSQKGPATNSFNSEYHKKNIRLQDKTNGWTHVQVEAVIV